jgi:hypothetical protein
MVVTVVVGDVPSAGALSEAVAAFMRFSFPSTVTPARSPPEFTVQEAHMKP